MTNEAGCRSAERMASPKKCAYQYGSNADQFPLNDFFISNGGGGGFCDSIKITAVLVGLGGLRVSRYKNPPGKSEEEWLKDDLLRRGKRLR